MDQVQEKKVYTLEELKKLSLQELQKIGRELELSRVTCLLYTSPSPRDS